MPYTKEQYLEDKSIVENAPKGATCVSAEDHELYYKEDGSYYAMYGGRWSRISALLGSVRLLQDIRDKIELYEQLAESEKLRYESIEAWSNKLEKAQTKIDKLEKQKSR